MMSSPTEKSVVVYRSRVDEGKALGEVLAKSNFFADCRLTPQATAKVLAGREIGLPPFASMTGIYTVKGRLTLSANAMAVLIQKFQFPNSDSYRFKFRVKKHTRKCCEIAFFERESPDGPWEEVGTSSFDEEDQKLAKLGGDNWTKYPRNMMYARAMSNGAKWYCPAVFAGHTPYLPDEVDQRAKATEDGEYQIDGKVVQTMQVDPNKDAVDAEIVDEEESHADLPVCVPGTPLAEICELIRETKSDVRRICTHYKVTSLLDMNEDAIANCRQTLLTKRSAMVS